jgi:hypothetical protein
MLILTEDFSDVDSIFVAKSVPTAMVNYNETCRFQSSLQIVVSAPMTRRSSLNGKKKWTISIASFTDALDGMGFVKKFQ